MLFATTSIASAEDRLISAIEIEGLIRVDEQLVLNNIRSSVGESYDSTVVQEDVRRITQLDEFKSIDASVILQEDGTVNIVFGLVEKAIIESVLFVGNTLLSDRELLAVVPMLQGVARDTFLIDRGRRAIGELYRKLGNFLVEVKVDEEELNNAGVLIYKIMEGPRVRVKRISFFGNNAFTEDELMSEIDSNISIPFFRRGELNEQVLAADVVSLKHFYINRGYRDVRISYTDLLSPNNKEAAVSFLIEEGPQITIGGISVTFSSVDDSEPCFTEEQIRELIPLKLGDVYLPTNKDKAVEAIKMAYGSLGRIVEITVYPIVKDVATVDMGFVIVEGRPLKVGLVEIKGNEFTEDHVIRGQIKLFPGDALDVLQLEQSRTNLLRTGRFDKVRITLAPENPNNPVFRNVLFEVQEMSTGSFEFGLMVGSDSGVMFNFNINLPTDISPTRTPNEILDAINTRGVAQQANRPLLLLERAWLAVSQIRTKLLNEEINNDELRIRIDEMIGWIMSADDPANLEGRFAAAKPLGRDFDAERLALLGVAITFAEAATDVALAKKSLDFSFLIMNDLDSKQLKYCLPYLIAGWLKPVHQIKDSTVCDEVFADLQSWLVYDSDLFQPEHLPWLDFAHVYVLSLRRLPNDAIAALPSLKNSVPDRPLSLLLQQTASKHISLPDLYTTQLSQRWVFDTIHALIRYSLATEAEEKELSRELLGLQLDEFPKELSDDLISRLMKSNLPRISKEDYDARVFRFSEMVKAGKITREQMQKQIDNTAQGFGLIAMVSEIKTRVIEDNISDARSLLDLLLSEEFQSKVNKLLESITSEEGSLQE